MGLQTFLNSENPIPGQTALDSLATRSALAWEANSDERTLAEPNADAPAHSHLLEGDFELGKKEKAQLTCEEKLEQYKKLADLYREVWELQSHPTVFKPRDIEDFEKAKAAAYALQAKLDAEEVAIQ